MHRSKLVILLVIATLSNGLIVSDVSITPRNLQLETEQRLLVRHEDHDDENDNHLEKYGDVISSVEYNNVIHGNSQHDGSGSALKTVAEAESSQPSLANHTAAATPPDQHTSSNHHHHHGPALEHLNETLILETHAPDLPSYYDLERTSDGKGGWLVAHIVSACLSFFVLLPLTIFVKNGKSSLTIIPQSAFLITTIVSLLCGHIYNSATPQLYEGSSHSELGWLIMLVVVGLNIGDVARFLFYFTPRRSQKVATQDRNGSATHDGENAPLFAEQDRFISESPTEEYHQVNAQDWTDVSLHTAQSDRLRKETLRSDSTHSDETLYETTAPESSSRRSSVPSRCFLTFGRYFGKLISLAEILIVVFAYVEILSGISVYTGSCRNAYINGCLAHMIKGSIFFFYGLLTWARYVGAFAEYGWAWNRSPKGDQKGWTAECVESLVCFMYGSTNVWLERLGKGDSPWSVKDVQHASIAIMFCFAGLLGMLLESRKVRSMLSTTAVLASNRDESRITPPASASFSFNPFPAIIIGTTGVAMSAHSQQYLFQVSIHALWGLLLALFSLSRFLTYFFLYLRPPASILPSRPPTEALASLFLTCGGVVFILSTEQVTFAAMRSGWDDIMAFLNVTVSFVSILFCWILVLFGIQGALLRRSIRRNFGDDRHDAKEERTGEV